MKFEITILGSGGAIPTIHKRSTSQFLNIQDRFFLLDCGEGTQIQLRKYHCKYAKINHIFISHLHGDHYLGLLGLLSTLNLLGRTSPIKLYAPAELKEIIDLHFKISGKSFRFNIELFELNFNEKTLLFEDSVVKVYSFPVDHSVPCCGFLFEEIKKERNIIKKKIENQQIPFHILRKLKNGEDFKYNDILLKSDEYTIDSPDPRSYAYCADTAYSEKIIPHIKHVDLLYHEATFLEGMKDRAIKTQHSTAKDAATIAMKGEVKKLIIGHFSARYNELSHFEEEAKAVFSNTIAVSDGDTFNL